MKRTTVVVTATVLAVGTFSSGVSAQQPSPSTPYAVGNALGIPPAPAAGQTFEPVSPNVKVFGAIYSAESCSYDGTRGVIVVPNRVVPQNVQVNDAFVSFINHDGSVNTARWIGVQSPADRAKLTPPLVLN